VGELFPHLAGDDGIEFPRWLAIDYGTAAAKMPEVVARAPHVLGIPIVFNFLPSPWSW
jgi:hypothetical protein